MGGMFTEDWIYCFLEGNQEHGPVCPSCSEKLLSIAQDGVYELKEEYKGKLVYNDQLEGFEEGYSEDIVLGYILN